MAKNYYETLGVDKSSSKEDIKKAYKKLARKYHPDVSQEDNAEQKFKEINEAAAVLLDDQKKQQYDTYGTAGGPQGFSGGGQGFDPRDFGINIDDIFESFGFGGFGGFGGGSSRGRQRKDTSIQEQVEISLEDVYYGVEKEINITVDEICSECSGKGAKNSKDVQTCSTCNGSGYIIETQRSILGAIRTQRTCPKCGGEGEQISNPCSKCGGEGTQREKKSVTIKIPKGIESGVTLKIKGKGNYDRQTSDYGDLYLRVFVKKHKKYDVEGSDLYTTFDINFVQAILGDEVELKHFDKTLGIKIPQGTQSGTVLRLKGKGLPLFNYNSNGDFYVKINVEIPSKTTKEQKEILMNYAKTLKDKSLIDRLKGLFR